MTGVLLAPVGGAKVALMGSDSSTANTNHPTPATANAGLANNGQVVNTDNSPYAWLTNGTPGAYEVMATLNSGSVSGTFGSWLNLGTTQSWSLTRSTLGTSVGQITLQIRPVGGSVITSGTISFTATVS